MNLYFEEYSSRREKLAWSGPVAGQCDVSHRV
jgi:hypothetical protein